MGSESVIDRDRALETIRRATESPAEYAVAWKRRTGRRVIGTFCSYVPEEVVAAAGALRWRVFPTASESGRADACLQSYACCLARGALEQGLAGELAFLDGVIFSNTCDTMQCLADIWSANVEGKFAETFMMPVHVSHPAGRDYVVAEIERLIASVGEKSGATIERSALRSAVATCGDARRALGRLHEVQCGPSPVLTPRQYHDAMMARWIVAPDEYASLINAVLEDVQVLDRVGPRIVIVGGPLYAPVVAELLGELGACWVADDLCTGWRAAWTGPEVEDDPVGAIADRLLGRPICPTKHAADYDPGQVVVDRAREAAADGVVIYRLKFCEPHAFDYPRIKEALDEAGVPSLLIEEESPVGPSGQLRTRLQAFLEMLVAAGVSEGRA